MTETIGSGLQYANILLLVPKHHWIELPGQLNDIHSLDYDNHHKHNEFPQ
jgi:hypothetical protein